VDGEELFDQDGPGLFEGESSGRRDVPDAPLALYRRYRPEVFSEVIGQEHVTEPLKRALTNNRVNHAYLFSGPRGCGKTSSARILARSLNCEQGPTPTPCGVCDSCRELSRSGGGSIDVIEIDAASHGGVDDARDLRERAFFAPVRSRYKIYIVDEAHMVTTAGFNALLKLVEEPPPHVKFIFATTEPEKVIGTIRSRTHHYPFRLIPPKTLAAYLTKICADEKVNVEPGVISMVVRAGAGSVRDSLSVLDQLLGGAQSSGVGYVQAAALLGYTPDSLLDEAVDAFAVSDSKSVFSAIDKVIESGQDPRRFTEDLLSRLRDLVIVAAVPDAFSTGLLEVSEDQAERFTTQARQIGIGGLTRASEILAAGLVSMRGTTAPRLNLELMCSRILLPGADAGERGIHARLEKLERRLDMGGTPSGSIGGSAVSAGTSAPSSTRSGSAQATSGPSQTGGPATSPGVSATSDSSAPPAAADSPASATRPRSQGAASPATGSVTPSPDAPRSEPRQTPARPASGPAAPAPAPDSSSAIDSALIPAPGPAAPIPPGELTTETLRRIWPEILSRVKGSRKFLWMVLSQFAIITELRGSTLWLTFKDAGSRDNFNRSNGEDLVSQVIAERVGAPIAVRARLESEPIPTNGGTAILFPAKTPDPGRSPRPPAEASTAVPSARSASLDVPVPAESASGLFPAEETAPLSIVRSAEGRSTHSSPPASSFAEPPMSDAPSVSMPPASSSRASRASARRVPTTDQYEPPDLREPPPDDEPDDEPDVEGDAIVEGAAPQEELLEEIFEAEFVKEEKTKPRTRAPRKKSS
jgi:DNA polymerase-3 subunit gamma/tau